MIITKKYNLFSTYIDPIEQFMHSVYIVIN